MKSIRVRIVDNNDKAKYLQFKFKEDVDKEYVTSDKFQLELIEKLKKDHYDIKMLTILVPVKSIFKRADLMKVGQQEADLWGATCTGVSCYSNIVVFKCQEAGEAFSVAMTNEEVNAQILMEH